MTLDGCCHSKERNTDTSLAPTDSVSSYLLPPTVPDANSIPVPSSARNKGKNKQVNPSPGPSSASIRNLPPSARTASEFTKNEIRDLQEEVHTLAQGVAEFIRDSTDTAHANGNAIDTLHENLLDVRGVLSTVAGEPTALGHAITNDALIQSLRDSSYQTAACLDQVTRALQRIEAAQAVGPRTADAALPAAGAGPAAAPERLPDVALVAPSPSSMEGRML
ncbi:hypothetical protein B0H14DRAFT_3473463 [Mycena olivaceomarginata]|nr:hypothetical protein B0H14DRAFT_3473463 [Mycena olivaceomarginata]